MDWRLRWAMGTVAALGAFAVFNAAVSAGDALPNGAGPLYGLGAVMAVLAGLCFWPWRRKHTAGSDSESHAPHAGAAPSAALSFEVSAKQVAEAQWEKSPAQRARYFAVGMLVSGLITVLLPLFGLTLRRMEGAPPAAIHLTGLALMVIGGVAMFFSLTNRGAEAGALVAKVLLWSIIVLMLLVPVAAIGTMLLGY